MDWFNVVLIIGVLAIVAAIAVEVFKIIQNNRTFDASDVSLDDKWVEKAFFSYAEDLTEEAFGRLGKPIKTQKGEYRVNFINQANKVAANAIDICCEGDLLSKDFCRYIEKEYPGIKRKDLDLAIFDYIDAREIELQQNMDAFLQSVQDITPEEFFEIKQRQQGDIVGVYIIHNETRNQYYVGQAKKLFFRINQHFTGHGNGDVYADYKYGDDFSIKIIKLSDSGYDDIDKLERDMIDKYDAYSIGYNRTSGNY